MNHQVIISIGSNTLPEAHIQWASQWLSTVLTDLRLSSCLWTPDIKGSGVMYLNRLATGCTTLTVQQLNDALKEAEHRCRRTPTQVTIDLDVLEYDGQRYHLRDWSRPYVTRFFDNFLHFSE